MSESLLVSITGFLSTASSLDGEAEDGDEDESGFSSDKCRRDIFALDGAE
eukprot:m.168828 g.168828  ORF g.168828 m.168828 type:complete len:50 (+) comp16468_c0_seq1:1614-1763(+)